MGSRGDRTNLVPWPLRMIPRGLTGGPHLRSWIDTSLKRISKRVPTSMLQGKAMNSDAECWECMDVAESRSMLSNRANEKKWTAVV